MPLDKFVLILVCVLAAAGATIWVGTLISAAIHVPFGWLLFVPVALVAYIFLRILAERAGNAEDDQYDKMDH